MSCGEICSFEVGLFCFRCVYVAGFVIGPLGPPSAPQTIVTARAVRVGKKRKERKGKQHLYRGGGSN